MTAEPPRARSHQRYELVVGPVDRDLAAARLWAAGAVGVWERADTLVAWFTSRSEAVPPGGAWSVEPDRDWQEAFKATIQPVRAGRVTIVPSWLIDDHPGEDANGELVLVIDPGRAFGTGHHATTALCLELLDELDLEGRALADIGCGTGVLAIAAARRGARAVAVDVDEHAIELTRSNAAANRADVEAHHGSVTALPGRVDVVVANLVTDVVLALLGPLVGACRDTLILSGIATERGGEVAEAVTATGFEVREVRERDGWVAIAAARRRG